MDELPESLRDPMAVLERGRLIEEQGIQLERDLVRPAVASQILGVSVQTLAIWRCAKRYSLVYVKIGSRVFYRRSDLAAFIKRNVIGEPEHRCENCDPEQDGRRCR